MTNRSPQHEEMPQGMNVFLLFSHAVEYRADGVNHAADEQPDDSADCNIFDERSERQHDDPAHENVADHGKFGKAFHVDRGERNADHAQRAVDRIQNVTVRIVQTRQTERRIGSDDEKIDETMIENAQNHFAAVGRERMINRGNGIREKHGNTEDEHRNQRDVIDRRRTDAGKDRADDCENGAQTVRNRADEFFPKGILVQRPVNSHIERNSF